VRFPQREFAEVVAHALTTSKPDGDFNTAVAGNAAVQSEGTDPVILVVKKHKTVLGNLGKYLNGYADTVGVGSSSMSPHFSSTTRQTTHL